MGIDPWHGPYFYLMYHTWYRGDIDAPLRGEIIGTPSTGLYIQSRPLWIKHQVIPEVERREILLHKEQRQFTNKEEQHGCRLTAPK
jgi:hypothetical protein